MRFFRYYCSFESYYNILESSFYYVLAKNLRLQRMSKGVVQASSFELKLHGACVQYVRNTLAKLKSGNKLMRWKFSHKTFKHSFFYDEPTTCRLFLDWRRNSESKINLLLNLYCSRIGDFEFIDFGLCLPFNNGGIFIRWTG